MRNTKRGAGNGAKRSKTTDPESPEGQPSGRVVLSGVRVCSREGVCEGFLLSPEGELLSVFTERTGLERPGEAKEREDCFTGVRSAATGDDVADAKREGRWEDEGARNMPSSSSSSIRG